MPGAGGYAVLSAQPVVTLHVWTVPAPAAPSLLVRTAAWRAGRRTGFSKLLGTTRSARFGLRDTDLRRWALLACWDDAGAAARFEHSALATAWQQAASQRWRALLRPLAVRGAWGRRDPFGDPGSPARLGAPGPAGSGEPGPGQFRGPVLVLTRARLRWLRASAFWRAIPAVAGDLAGRPGLRFAFGIGEAPVGWQGTLSLWESTAAARGFAYAGPAHPAVIARSQDERWYAEQLFARFGVVAAAGTVDGRDPLR
ncbi:MAG TPA: monooxygenase [Micromonosporaceae bacterium]|nr:monooxygenase [Micromonosporaceae bacterium]